MNGLCIGTMCQGLHFESGHYVGFLLWDDSPAQAKAIREVWLISPDGKRCCYFDPAGEKEFFERYYDFENVIGADIRVIWPNPNSVSIRIEAEDNSRMNIEVEVPNWFPGPFPPVAATTGKGKKASIAAERVAVPQRVAVSLNDKDLGAIVKPSQPVSAGAAPLPDTPRILFCRMELELVP